MQQRVNDAFLASDQRMFVFFGIAGVDEMKFATLFVAGYPRASTDR